jgi:hypothetical protein
MYLTISFLHWQSSSLFIKLLCTLTYLIFIYNILSKGKTSYHSLNIKIDIPLKFLHHNFE